MASIPLKTGLATDNVDVLIVGAGPAGLMASLCLRTFGLSVLHIDNRSHPTVCGRADGLQARTLEILRNIGRWTQPRTIPAQQLHQTAEPTCPIGLGIAKNLIAQGVRIYEVAFWGPTEQKPLERTSTIKSCPDFIDVREHYTLLIHQGIIEREFLTEISARSPSADVLRPCSFISCQILDAPQLEFPVESVIELQDGTQKKILSKYLLGCDGAKSDVRKSLNGAIRLEGEGFDIVWGVMDCWVESDFPDLKRKCFVNSKNDGSIMVIPRENNLVRFYVQLKEGDLHLSKDLATLEICQKHAKKIFSPYTLNFGATDWFSVYQIGQRIANAYTLGGRIILGGDAVHTHSPKAGQGMNISMSDMYSLAWKINLVEKGLGRRDVIIETYEQERRGVAQELLAFDSKFSTMLSGHNRVVGVVSKNNKISTQNHTLDPQKLISLCKQNAFFTSGCGAIYHANVFNALPDSDVMIAWKPSEVGGPLKAGQRLLPGMVTRAVDGNPVKLEQEIKMDGAFRIYLFVGHAPIGNRLAHLENQNCFLHRFRAPHGQACSIFDSQRLGPNPFFTFLLVSSQPRDEWEIEDLPTLFSGPYRSQVYLDDMPNQISGEKSQNCSLHHKYGFEEGELGGAIIIVRPDGYVGLISKLNQDTWTIVEQYFDGFLIERPV
ncbi:hypothetical protein O181_053227 [Austropuccinia psidii MF-1]|uniref:Phenol 2-monooxygenase n=1 Tax=Austropuccinia psidii MF-1 TaxID=1389203 RepID=A0A9Q3E989_9BASI|nr:hypothetical protein [Austropuccinia psidii MF-1]